MGKMDSLKCSFLRVDLQRKSEDLPTHLTAAAFIHHRAYIAQIWMASAWIIKSADVTEQIPSAKRMNYLFNLPTLARIKVGTM